MLEHGGRLRIAAQRYSIALERWLDLSTGIAPYTPALPTISADAWRRLPELDDGLEAAACAYYGAQKVLAVAGSQAAIQALPRLRRNLNVAIVTPAYAEHSAAWQREGHHVSEISVGQIDAHIGHVDVLVLINPCNPTGQFFQPQQLLDWHAALAARSGWLVVDEAFIDCTPQLSLAPLCSRDGLIVLRSIGKFFGLAGARLGFVLAPPQIVQALAELLGPWTISGPTRHVVTHLLSDTAGQSQQRQQLLGDGQRLQQLLLAHGLAPTGGCAFFQWLALVESEQLHEFLAQHGILTRLFKRPLSVRFGLPGEVFGWQRLEHALRLFSQRNS